MITLDVKLKDGISFDIELEKQCDQCFGTLIIKEYINVRNKKNTTFEYIDVKCAYCIDGVMLSSNGEEIINLVRKYL